MKSVQRQMLVMLCQITLSACAGILESTPKITGLHHDLKVRLEPASHQFIAEDVVTVNAQGTIRFALGGQFTVTAISKGP